MFNGTVPKLCERFYFNVPYLLKTNSFISDSFKMFTRKKQQQKNPLPPFLPSFYFLPGCVTLFLDRYHFHRRVCVCVS